MFQYSFSIGSMALGPLCEVYIPPEISERGGNGHIQAQPGTLVTLPRMGEGKYHVGEVLCEHLWKNRAPQEVCPRYAARQQIHCLQEEFGWKIKSAFEAEFCLFENETNNPIFRHEQVDTTSAMAPVATLLMDVATEMRQMGMTIEKFNTEYGECQFEFNLSPNVGISSPDAMFRFKEVLKELCRRQNIIATFMSWPFPSSPTNGLHFNHSIWDANGRNVFFDASDEHNISAIAKHWLAGLIEHASALTALSCPTTNCYRRLHSFLAPKNTQWEFDSRWVCFRVLNEDERHTYLESRLPSGAANPYLLLAGHIAAGLDGVRRKLPLTPPMQEDAKELPHSLEEALEALKKDELICQAVGPKLVNWFIDSKTKLEIEPFKNHNYKVIDADELTKERDMYLVL